MKGRKQHDWLALIHILSLIPLKVDGTFEGHLPSMLVV